MTQAQPKLAIFSYFSGAGFLDLGFEHAGFEIVHVNEIHGPFLDAYKFSREILKIPKPRFGYHAGSIDDYLQNRSAQKSALALQVQTLRNEGVLSGFIGGPPCPDFSVGGKNKGQNGENGRLSRSYVDMIIKNKPDFFVFENVKGLWRTAKHREFFEELKTDLRTAGYVLTERLINSIEYGVAQDRDRIILFGVRNKLASGVQLSQFYLDENFDWELHTKYPNRSAFAFPWPEMGASSANEIVPKDLTVQSWFDRNDVLNHPNAGHCFVPRAGLAKFRTILEGDVSRKSYKRLHRFRFSPTAAYGNNEVHIHPIEPRRISAAEALAIQSLPKQFQLPPTMTLSNMFKTIGNGVPYLAGLGVAQTVKDFFKNIHVEIASK
jgi:DNA (cytosine-5)-methyltransferase 1